MKSTSYILGFACGLAAVAFVCLILHFIRARKHETGCPYDERQLAIQGKGFKLAFFTGMGLLVLLGMFDAMTGLRWAELFPTAMICLWASICVFVTFCALKDAYLSLRSRRKTLIVFFLVMAVIELTLSTVQLAYGGSLATDGLLNIDFVTLLTGVAVLYIALLLLFIERRERRMKEEVD